MAIVPLCKLTLLGMNAQQQTVLDQLQDLGCVHLVPLRQSDDASTSFESKEAIEAYRYLLRAPIKRRLAADHSQFQREALVAELLEIKDRRAELWAERDELRHAIELVTPWGDFQLPAEDDLPGQQFYFYMIPLREQSHLPDDLIWQVVSRDNRFAYVVVIANEPPAEIDFERVELDRRGLSQLRSRLEAVEQEREELQWRRITLTRWRKMLRDDLDAADDQTAKMTAAKGIQADHVVFALQGWMPTAAADDVRELAQQNQLALTMERPGEDDSPPTLLHNPDRVAGAEGCVTFYITPGYHTWDPTRVVFFSLSLFFAMIISDAGYGLIMAGILAVAWRRIGRRAAGRKFRNLLVGIVSASVIYGVLVGSYFGTEPPAGSVLDWLRVRIGGQPMMKNQNAMMVIAVAIGVAHLSLANIISACQQRKQLRFLGHLGWAMLMIGGFLIGSQRVTEIEFPHTFAVGLASLGGICILLFSSERPLLTLDWKTQAMRLVDGVTQVTNLTKAFGDVLSYLRLFALGLASAQLAVTFNDLAGSVSQKGGIGILLAIFILLVGHGINFVLGLMGGVVHGLRLNCIEFFNWGLCEEGYAFTPFKKKANR